MKNLNISYQTFFEVDSAIILTVARFSVFSTVKLKNGKTRLISILKCIHEKLYLIL